MRTPAFALFALCVIACAAPQRDPAPIASSTPPPITIDLDDALRERLALGLPMRLELQSSGTAVGECTVVYDLWDERYEVALSRTEIAHAPDPAAALRMCVDMVKVDDVRRAKGRAFEAALRAREAPHLYRPRTDYPVF